MFFCYMVGSGLHDHPQSLLVDEAIGLDGDGLDVEAVGAFDEFEEELVGVLRELKGGTSVIMDFVSWVTTLNSLLIFIMAPDWLTQMAYFVRSLL
jgi:hypothetical protein